MSFAYSIDRILEILGSDCELVGEYSGSVVGIASLAEADAGDLSFLGNPKYKPAVAHSKASVLLLPHDYDESPQVGQLYIKLKHPSFALALICRDIEQSLLPKPEAGVHTTAYIHPDAQVDPSASIGPFCLVGKGAIIGANVVLESQIHIGQFVEIKPGSYLYPRVVVSDYCVIGERNRLLSGSVIGADGYGYEFMDGAHQRVPQIGNVVTEADVDVGANTTIDRARFGSTLIGQGTKIDNQVQIAHNVRIGKCCLIVAQVGISGSTTLGDGVILGGQVGVAGHLHIGSGVMAAGSTAITSSIEPKQKVRGNPAEPMMLHNRIAVLQRKLPDLFKRFDHLEKTVESLTSQTATDQ